jgi:nucleoside-diphosphate-sugar epimerase
MKILVTGAEGNVGSALTQYLVTKGHLVVPFVGNVTDYWNWDKYVGDFDALIHLAGIAGVRDSIGSAELYYDVNVGGMRNALNWAQFNSIPRVLYASSSNVHEWWLNPYATTKKMCEALATDCNAIGLRFHTIYPGREDMLYQRLLANDVSMINIKHRRDYIHINDVCSAIELTLENYDNLKRNIWLDVGTGYSTSIVDVAMYLDYKGAYANNDTPHERTVTCADVHWLNNLGWIQTKDVLDRDIATIADYQDAEVEHDIWELYNVQLDRELNEV